EGTIDRILVEEGTEGVQVNAVIAVLVAEGEEGRAADPSAKSSKTNAAPAEEAADREDQKDESPEEEAVEDEAVEEAESKRPAPTGSPGTGAVDASPLAAKMAKAAGIDLSTLTGSGPGGRITKEDVEAAVGGAGSEQGASVSRSGRIFVSPLARRMAEQAGIDLATLKGSGPNGRIVKADIEAAARRPADKPAAAAAPAE